MHPLTGKERFVPIYPKMLIQQVFHLLIQSGSTGLVGTPIPNMLKMPVMVANRKGELKEKQIYTAIGVVVAIRLKEDEELEQTLPEEKDEDQPVSYRGAYMLISNRTDVPDEVLSVYAKRWRIEVLFRRAKQDLGMANCHSITENHHHAHLELLFAADTLLGYAIGN